MLGPAKLRRLDEPLPDHSSLTMEIALAWCLVYLMTDELGIGAFAIDQRRQTHRKLEQDESRFDRQNRPV